MRKIGEWRGEDVGCFVLLRVDTEPMTPVFTVHRVTRVLAHIVTGQLQSLTPCKYTVAGVESVCDCQGTLELEP